MLISGNLLSLEQCPAELCRGAESPWSFVSQCDLQIFHEKDVRAVPPSFFQDCMRRLSCIDCPVKASISFSQILIDLSKELSVLPGNDL